MISNKELNQLYDNLNQDYFGGRLPPLKVYYKKLSRQKMGRTIFQYLDDCKYCRKLRGRWPQYVKDSWLPVRIEIDKDLSKGKASIEVSYTTLLHEMIHVSIGGKYNDDSKRYQSHGSKFRKEKKRLLRAGALDVILD